MSKKVDTLLVFPPDSLDRPKAGEVFKFGGHQCPQCNGKGGHYYGDWAEKFKEKLDDSDWKVCPVCKGTGELEGNVVVGWVPCGVVKEQFKELGL